VAKLRKEWLPGRGGGTMRGAHGELKELARAYRG
jgi:hypothetical protein